MKYLNNEEIRNLISKYIDKPICGDTPGLCSDRFIRFFNDNFLKQYLTKITTLEKKYYKLETSWQILMGCERAQIAQSGIDSRFSNAEYEEEIYEQIMANLHNHVEPIPIDEGGYTLDPTYNRYRIVNVFEWNNTIIRNQNDLMFIAKMRKVFIESTVMYIYEKKLKQGIKTSYTSVLEQYEKKINFLERRHYP